ncbi:MAG: 5-(carboxyamino)imidazole ribonucleotide mutase [Bacteroidota bacterium]|jgi:5-(carboxyamino)imidazole ribonucleotide mutase|uniref:PurE domain-containing protein n=1 Tax=marine metagenome TaxID=408172 RepID=A0A381NXL5_9ZZZZ|nr:5-(carboxyamino)imidazole ribonucleotide mutase [Bacteroidota bacterium]|tara:strand:+ start:439 stop:918 length:480 start_codon:yes stop_codon:yes gene_type:complete
MAKVSIVMGSKSDLPVMQEASKILDYFGIENDVSIMSAHRTPKRAAEFSESAIDNGTKVIIAGAGGAAHLAGVMASLTTLPVIGVPIKSSNSIDGWDSLLSTVQMPSGIPVATVAINGAKNAGILAAQMIGISNQEISNAVKKFKTDLAQKVEKDNASL